jgi:hypothetical protein
MKRPEKMAAVQRATLRLKSLQKRTLESLYASIPSNTDWACCRKVSVRRRHLPWCHIQGIGVLCGISSTLFLTLKPGSGALAGIFRLHPGHCGEPPNHGWAPFDSASVVASTCCAVRPRTGQDHSWFQNPSPSSGRPCPWQHPRQPRWPKIRWEYPNGRRC